MDLNFLVGEWIKISIFDKRKRSGQFVLYFNTKFIDLNIEEYVDSNERCELTIPRIMRSNSSNLANRSAHDVPHHSAIVT